MRLFGKLFGGRSGSEPTDGAGDVADDNPRASAQFTDRVGVEEPKGVAYAQGEENLQEEHDHFCASFQFKPGVLFLEFLRKEGVTRMIEWIDWRSPYPEPKAIIRLVLDMQQRGENFWDQSGITIFVAGSRSDGGGPSQESQDAISVFAQITGKPVKVYYRDKAGGDAPLVVKEFEP